MSYHNIPSSARQSTTNAQGQAAPAGFHYMPDGTLMSDAEHASLFGSGNGKGEGKNKYIDSEPPKPPSPTGTCTHAYFLALADELLWPLVDTTNQPDPALVRSSFEWNIQYAWDKFVLGPDGVYTPDPSQPTGCQVLRDIIISDQDYIAQYLTPPPTSGIGLDSLLWHQTRISWATTLLEVCDCNETPPEDIQAKLSGECTEEPIIYTVPAEVNKLAKQTKGGGTMMPFWTICPNMPATNHYQVPPIAPYPYYVNANIGSYTAMDIAALDPTWDPNCSPAWGANYALCGGTGSGTPAGNAATLNNQYLWIEAFYTDVITQLGVTALSPGDTIAMTENACWGVEPGYCITYDGHFPVTGWMQVPIVHYPTFSGTPPYALSCNDCKECWCPDSWDCNPSTGGCYDPQTGNGQYTTLADCEAACEVTSSWDCVTSIPNIGEVSPVSLYDTWGGMQQCIERIWPMQGQYATEQNCINSGCGGTGGPIPTDPILQPIISPRGDNNIDGYVRRSDGRYIKVDQFQEVYGDLSEKVITSFKLDLSDLSSTTETRNVEIIGDIGAEFILEIRNEDNYYYNFYNDTFQAAKSVLEGKLVDSSYKDSIVFPTVTDNDHYDIYLHAKAGTRHVARIEERFGDGTVDLNSSIGSNSSIMQKIIYQYTTLTLTLSPYSPNSTVAGTGTNGTLTVFRNKSKEATAFSTSILAGTTAAYRIIKQPASSDVLAFVSPVIGAAPITLPGENIYPTVNNTDTVDGATTTATKIVMDTNVADKMKVGDKITIATTDLTDTVDGAVSSGVKVVMDNNVATKMAVGDRITAALSGVPHALLNNNSATIVTVAALNPDGDNVKEFSMSQAVSLSDGETLTFTPKCNRELFTVAELNPDSDNAKEFSYVDEDGGTSSRFGVRDGATLSFSNQMNYSWPINNFAHKLKEDMIIVPGTNVTTSSTIKPYIDRLVTMDGTEFRKQTIINEKPAVSTVGKTPTVVEGLVTVQAGDIVFNNQQPLALAGDTIKVGGYGEGEILRLLDWEVKFSNLAITLTAQTTTTTSAVVGSATIPVADREGVINNVSRIGGIGIKSSVQNPLITSGGGADGAGNWTADAVQDLESGTTLTVENTSRTATITGNIEIIKAGTADQTLRFDIEKLLSTSA